MASGARVVVSTPAGNGAQPVVTLVPPGFDAARPARVHTHYHGFNSSVAEPATHAAGVTKNLVASLAAKPQTIFVLPECGNVPPTTTTPEVKTDWSNVKNIATTAADAVAAAGYARLEVSERVVSAHSGGGTVFGFAMRANPDGSGLRADRLELEDCMYGGPAGMSARDALTAWARTANGAEAKTVVYYEGDGGNGAKPDAAMRRAFAGRLVTLGGYGHNEACAKTLDRPVRSTD